MRKLIAVYGSLRVGEYNFNRLSKFGKLEHVATTSIQGYDLYSLGPYPAVKEGNGTIVVDILEADDNSFRAIDGMEKGAGYVSKVIDYNGEDATLYLYTGYVDQNRLVESGDWSKYLSTNKKEQYV